MTNYHIALADDLGMQIDDQRYAVDNGNWHFDDSDAADEARRLLGRTGAAVEARVYRDVSGGACVSSHVVTIRRGDL